MSSDSSQQDMLQYSGTLASTDTEPTFALRVAMLGNGNSGKRNLLHILAYGSVSPQSKLQDTLLERISE